jgi:ABC-type transport system involved in multi-copper enzyme maturation permease subunit
MVPAFAFAFVFALVATLVVYSSSPARGPVGPQGGTTLELLGRQGGATEAFAVGMSFVGFFVFVSITALLAGEFANGTFRAVLLRNPRRLEVIAGKLVGILVVAAALLAFAELSSTAISFLLAGGKDVSTSEWLTAGSALDGLGDFARAFAGVAGWGIFGATLAVLLRSTPLALGVGIAWAGPFENIIVDGWTTGLRVFPGQVLRAIMNGGTPELGLGRAAVTGLLYAAVAGAVCLTVLSRRDVTG